MSKYLNKAIMSIDRTDYIMYGIRLPDSLESIDLYADEFVAMREGHEGEKFTLVVDGMGGDYAFFGICYLQTDDFGRGDGWYFEPLPCPTESDRIAIKSKYEELFGMPSPEPIFFITTHFS